MWPDTSIMQERVILNALKLVSAFKYKIIQNK